LVTGNIALVDVVNKDLYIHYYANKQTHKQNTHILHYSADDQITNALKLYAWKCPLILLIVELTTEEIPAYREVLERVVSPPTDIRWTLDGFDATYELPETDTEPTSKITKWVDHPATTSKILSIERRDLLRIGTETTNLTTGTEKLLPDADQPNQPDEMGLLPNDKVYFVIPQKKPNLLLQTHKINIAFAENENPIPLVYPSGTDTIRNFNRDIRENANCAKFAEDNAERLAKLDAVNSAYTAKAKEQLGRENIKKRLHWAIGSAARVENYEDKTVGDIFHI
jgi:hypothetical protein